MDVSFCNQAARPPNFPPRTDSFVQMSLEPDMCYLMHSHHHCGCNNTWAHHTTPPIPPVFERQSHHIHPSTCVHYHVSRSARNFGLHHVENIIQLKQLFWSYCRQQTEAGIALPVDLTKKKKRWLDGIARQFYDVLCVREYTVSVIRCKICGLCECVCVCVTPRNMSNQCVPPTLMGATSYMQFSPSF